MDISTDFLFNTIQGKILGNLIIYAIYVNFFHIKGVKKFIKWLCKFYDNQTKFGIYLLAAFIVILIAAITYPISVHNYSGKNITIFILFYLSALIFITGFFNQKSRNGELKNEYDSLLKYMSEYEKALDEKSKNQHEYKNQLIMIENMIEEKNEKARSYIKQLLNEKENKNVELLNNLKSLPQGGLKGLIYFKAERMIEKGMEVHIHVDEVLDSRKLWNTCEKELQDISRIIGVYIDNAIEATEIADKKYIIIDIEYEKDTIIFSFSNTYKGSIEIDKIDQEGYSTKAKKRGYGLSLVQDIIQKNEVLSQTREINGIFFVQKLIIQNKK
jgi:low affinity Fe/Cu permease